MRWVYTFFLLFCFNANAIKTSCGNVSVKNGDNSNILINFYLDDGCVFYTTGKQDISNEPTILVDNENVDIGNINWPSGVAKKDSFGDETYEHTVSTGNFSITVPFSFKKQKSAKDFNITINYQVCRNMQCKSESLPIQIKDGVVIGDGEEYVAEESQKNISTFGKTKTILLQLIIAFLSGAVLNLMPCVLPILGIKIASLSYGNKTHTQITSAAAMSLLGILVTFTALGVAGSFIKIPFSVSNGEGVQLWGAMFQNRYFLLLITIIVAIFIDINRGRALISIHTNNNFGGKFYHFFSGVLSTVLASPCVAPVIGISLVVSMNSDFFTGVAIFVAIGLGFGLPYIIAIFNPDIYKKLPKTGKLSIAINFILQALLFGTFFWLIYVLINQIGMQIGLVVMMGIFLFSHFGWKMKSVIAKIIFAAILITPMVLLTEISYDNKTIDDEMWQPFSAKKLDKALNEESIVLVLGTADWCSWCHILEKTILERQSFIEFVNQNSIVLLKADMTDSNNSESNTFYRSQDDYGLPILRIYSNTNPAGKSIVLGTFSVKSVISQIEQEIQSMQQISTK